MKRVVSKKLSLQPQNLWQMTTLSQQPLFLVLQKQMQQLKLLLKLQELNQVLPKQMKPSLKLPFPALQRLKRPLKQP